MIMKALSDSIRSDGKPHPGCYFEMILMQEPVTQLLTWFPSMEGSGQQVTIVP